MCGRAYETYTEEELYLQYLNKRPPVPLQFTPTYNLCPTQNSLILRLIDGGRGFETMRSCTELGSGLATKLSTINAKIG